MIRALILLLLAGCAHSHSEEQHAEVAQEAHETAHAEAQSAASGRTTAGPETITTTVEEYGAPQAEGSEVNAGGLPAVQAPQAAGGEGQAQGQRPAPATAGLIRRTVTVDQRGPVDTSWMANASGTQGAESQTTLHAASEAHSASKWRVGLPWLLLLPIALALWLARGKLKLALGAVRAMVG